MDAEFKSRHKLPSNYPSPRGEALARGYIIVASVLCSVKECFGWALDLGLQDDVMAHRDAMKESESNCVANIDVD